MPQRPVSLVGVIVSIAAMAPIPPTHAQQPVHEVQVTAKKFAFEPAMIEVTAGETSPARPSFCGCRPRVRDSRFEHRRRH